MGWILDFDFYAEWNQESWVLPYPGKGMGRKI
jgi:hypothetical protein